MVVNAIELINVTKKFKSVDEITALKDITLTIRQGEFIGILGMNGSGKSTLARLLNGLVKPTAGKIYINGMDFDEPKNLMKIRQLVGMIFQNPDDQLVCPVVKEEIAFGPENLGLPASEVNNRVTWALQIMNLEKLRQHAPHLLSGGQKQKVALASVLAMLPKYLILDEPTSMLDPLSRHELLEYLRKINSQNGITVVLISHNPEDLLYADRLIILDHGSVYLHGTPREVYTEVDKLAAIGLKPPGIYQMINQFEEDGYEIDDSIKTIEELVETYVKYY
ncbi:energy-coupling factor transporter ATPase [Desulfitobacterium sp. Sab5]|uniref:energy-coupling factor transporter ATPase n=1 Tax=Desulfitobacterium nosdiversum TaxID=3375356 RepID=UPI003CF10F7D